LTFHLQVRRAAELDIAQAKAWYETQRTGLGTQFQAEISHAFSILEETPFIYPVVYRDVRRAIVHRFPYLIWYRIIDEQVIVLACSHARQSPEKSRSRLR
jgi:plasmid stabilization system protein ParE